MTCKPIRNLPITDNCIIAPSLLKPDWTELTLQQPYQDLESRKYVVVVPMDNPRQSNDEYKEQLEEAKTIAVQTLFDQFGKVGITENLQKVFLSTEVLDVHILTRPNIPCPEGFIAGLGMKVQVGIDKDVFDAIPFSDYVPLPPSTSEAIFSSADIESDLRSISGIILGIASNPEKKADFGLDIDLREDVDLLNSVLPSLKALFLSNNKILDKNTEETIIIGFDANNIPLYVLVDDGRELLRLRCSFGNFIEAFNNRIGVYLVNKEQITRKGNFGTSVKDILGSVKQLKIPSLQLDNPLIKGIITIERIREEYDRDGLKTEEETEKESLDFDNPEIAVRIRKEAIDFNLQQQIETNLAVLKNIKDLDSAFQFFLNRVDIRCKLAAAMKCISVQLPLDLVKGELVKSYLANLTVDEFLEVSLEVGIVIETYEDFVSILRKELEKCYVSLNVGDREDLKKQIELRLNKPIQSETDIQKIESISDLLIGFGWRGTQIKERVYAERKGEMADKLVDLVGTDAFDNLSHNAGSGLTLATTAFDELSNLDICELFLNLPDLFTIRFPFRIPVFDIDGAIFTALLNGILEALTQAILEFVRSLILDLFRFCEEGGAFGIGNFFNSGGQFPDFGEFLGGQVTDALGNAAINGLGFDPTNLSPGEFAENLLRRLNLFPDISFDDGGLGKLGEEVADLFKTISSVLTPGELSALLLGNAPQETNRIVSCIIDSNYSSLSSALSDNGRQGKDFFAGLGKIINRAELLNQVRLFADLVNDKKFCDADILDFRRDILAGKGIDKDNIDKQLNKEQARKLARFAELANMLENDDYMQKALPNIFGCDENKSGSPLLNINPPSIQRAMGQVLQAIWEPTEMSFDRETSNFQSALYENVSRSKKINKYKKDVVLTGIDGTTREIDNIVNPEWTRLVAQGMQDDIYDDSGEIDEDATFDEDRSITIQENVGQDYVAPGLRESFQGFFGSRTKLQSISNGIRINIDKSSENPFQNLSQAQQNQRFSPTNESLQGFAGSLAPNTPNQDLDLNEAFGSAMPRDAFVEYRYESFGTKDEDVFSLNGTYVIGVGNRCKQDAFSIISREKIDPLVLTFIEEEGLSEDGYSGIRQQKLFADFWRKKWISGFGALSIGQAAHTVSAREFAGDKFFRYFNVLLSVLGSNVAESELFRKENFSKIPLPPVYDPICDNHLLKIDSQREKVRQNTLKDCSFEGTLPNTDPNNPKMGTFELENLKSIVNTIVRLYVIEVWMKSFFVNAEFSSNEVDSLTKLFIQKEISRDLKEISFSFYENFIKIAKEMTGLEKDEEAISKLIEEAIPSTFSDLNKIVESTKNEKNILKTFVSDALPVFDVWKDPSPEEITNKVRFHEVEVKTKKKTITIPGQTPTEVIDTITTTLNNKKERDMTNKVNELFKPELGGFYLEKFARVSWKPSSLSVRNQTGIFEVCSLRELSDFHRNHGMQNHLSSVKLGIRIMNSLPVKESDFHEENSQVQTDFSGIFVDDRCRNNRAFAQKEQYIKVNKVSDGNETKTKMVRLFHSVPLVEFDDFSFDLTKIEAGTDFEVVWNNNRNFFIECMTEQPEFRFVFDYVYPVKRIVGILSAYSFLYLSSKLEIDTMYDGTKIALKRLLEATLNSGKYDYNTGLHSNAGMMNNATPEESGIDLLGMMLKTPLLILKGLTEQVDPNISIASKIKLAGLALGKDLPMGLLSLGLLPINVFMPPPFGIGIGPPITPLGFAYLALGLGGGLPEEQYIDATKAGINPADLKKKVKIDEDC